ncbi:lipase [Phytomonospora endophytica]|uniref:Lipase n=1 Tax=Phytomonospora endophytica TaxID=714109 RepID=A0A841FI54_9ACTN|nr:lipase [Phytomonospora endophytica]MBB6035544.1 hypothetical protein [Phytomonospora endophytica]GIG70093.1 lipase [Phytomonospora endophytica]
METTRRALLTAAGTAALTVPFVLPGAAAAAEGEAVVPVLPAPTGPYPVGRTELHLIDHSRPDPWLSTQPYREIMISVWYPARDIGGHERARVFPARTAAFMSSRSIYPGVPAGAIDWAATTSAAYTDAPAARCGRAPVLLSVSGHFQPREMWTTMSQELASRGYVVVTASRTHEFPVEFPDGRYVDTHQPGPIPPSDPIPWLRQTMDSWCDDARHILDSLEVLAAGGDPSEGDRPLPDGLGRLVDPARTGTFGANAGGAAGAIETAFRDRRVDAVHAGEAGFTYEVDGVAEPFVTFHENGIRRPLLVMRASTEYQTADPLYDRFFGLCTGPARELELVGAGQGSQNDQQTFLPRFQEALGLPPGHFAGEIGDIVPRRSVRAQKAYLTAFFDRYLRRRGGHLLDGPSPAFPEVAFRR